MKTSSLSVVRRSCSCSKIYDYQNSVRYWRPFGNRIRNEARGVEERPVSSTSTKPAWPRLSYGLIIALGLCLVCPAFAEQRDRKADGKPEEKIDDRKMDDRMQAEANLPIYHGPLKASHANGLDKNQSETKLLPLRQPQIRSPRVATVPLRSKTAEAPTELSKSTLPGVSNERSLSKLDSLAQTQDKARQRVLYGFKQNEIRTTSPQPVLSEGQKSPVAKPVAITSLQTAINKTPILPSNAAIWVRNASVPHRGPNPAPPPLGGPATVKPIGLNGAEMKRRP